jgi:hypothetical protein
MRPILCSSAAAAIVAAGLSLAAPAAAAPASVVAARHEGVISPASIRWRSEYVLRGEAPPSIALAFPLPEGTVLDASADVDPIEKGGRVVALRVLPHGAVRGRLAVTLTEPLDRHGDALRLAPPLAAGEPVQLVDVTGGDDLRFEPEPRTQLERHVGFFAPAELPPSARDACDRAVGYARARTIDDPMYVQAFSAVVVDEGIRGTLSSRGDRARAGAVGAGGVFVALLIGLALIQRKLGRAARLEEAERTLAELGGLDE